MENAKLTKIISREKLKKLFEEEEQGKRFFRFEKLTEFEGRQYNVFKEDGTNNLYAVQAERSLHMGFNSNEPGKEDEFLRIMENEGVCRLSWGVTGRTAHRILAHQFAEKYPEYRWEIGDNYECKAYDDHRMVLQPGFEPEVMM